MKRLSFLLILTLLLALVFSSCGKEPEKKSYVNAKSLSDFEGVKLGVQAGTVNESIASQIKDAKIDNRFTDLDLLLIALKATTIDAYILELPQAVATAKKYEDLTYIKLENNNTGFTVTESQSGIAIGVKKGNELKEEINTILAEISVETREALMNQMVALSNGENVEKLALDIPEVPDYKGTLKVGMECASMPWNWTDVENTLGSVPISGEGKDGLYANGYDVVISSYVAARLGLKLEVYAYDWNSLIPGVKSGALDAIIAGMSPTDERKEEIDFTNLYYDVTYVLMIRK